MRNDKNAELELEMIGGSWEMRAERWEMGGENWEMRVDL